MIKTKEDFKNKYIDLSNTELNGEMTEVKLVRLSECLGEIGYSFIINRSFIKEGSSCISAGRDDGEEEDIFYSPLCVKGENQQEVSVFNIAGFDESDSVSKEEEEHGLMQVTEKGKKALGDITSIVDFDTTDKLCVEIKKGGENIMITPHNFEKIKNFFYNNSGYPKGSRMWAFEMLDRGEKVRHKSWNNEKYKIVGEKYKYIYMEGSALFENNDKLCEAFNWWKDGWELYEEKEEKPETMTLREACNKGKTIKFKNGKSVSFSHFKDCFEDFAKYFNNLDTQVEIIEEKQC